MLSLFRVVTLEDWTDVMYIQMYGSEAYGVTGGNTVGAAQASVGRPIFAALFFVSFVLFGTMIILNLFIGVIMNGMDEVRREEYLNEMAATRRQDKISLHDEISLINEQLANLQKHLDVLQHRLIDEHIHADSPKPIATTAIAVTE
jgi:voltage-gated sodium channel